MRLVALVFAGVIFGGAAAVIACSTFGSEEDSPQPASGSDSSTDSSEDGSTDSGTDTRTDGARGRSCAELVDDHTIFCADFEGATGGTSPFGFTGASPATVGDSGTAALTAVPGLHGFALRADVTGSGSVFAQKDLTPQTEVTLDVEFQVITSNRNYIQLVALTYVALPPPANTPVNTAYGLGLYGNHPTPVRGGKALGPIDSAWHHLSVVVSRNSNGAYDEIVRVDEQLLEQKQDDLSNLQGLNIMLGAFGGSAVDAPVLEADVHYDNLVLRRN